MGLLVTQLAGGGQNENLREDADDDVCGRVYADDDQLLASKKRFFRYGSNEMLCDFSELCNQCCGARMRCH